MTHPMTTKARELIDTLAACLNAADLHVPEHRGVAYCTECVIPGCCDHLVAVMKPALQRGCVADRWDVTVLYGRCYAPCAGTPETFPQPEQWLPDQETLAEEIEDAFWVLVDCQLCPSCDDSPVSVEKFCSGGCAGFRLTYSLSAAPGPAIPPDPYP